MGAPWYVAQGVGHHWQLRAQSNLDNWWYTVCGIRFLTRKYEDLSSFSITSRFLCLRSAASLAALEHYSSSTDFWAPLCTCCAMAAVAAASGWHWDSACCFKSSVAWFQWDTPLVVQAPLDPAEGLPHFWHVAQNHVHHMLTTVVIVNWFLSERKLWLVHLLQFTCSKMLFLLLRHVVLFFNFISTSWKVRGIIWSFQVSRRIWLTSVGPLMWKEISDSYLILW